MSQSTTTWQDSWRAFAEEINYLNSLPAPVGRFRFLIPYDTGMTETTRSWKDHWRQFASELGYSEDPFVTALGDEDSAEVVEKYNGLAIRYQTSRNAPGIGGPSFSASVQLPALPEDLRFEIDPMPTLVSHLFGWKSLSSGDEDFDSTVVAKTNNLPMLNALVKEADLLRAFIVESKLGAQLKPASFTAPRRNPDAVIFAIEGTRFIDNVDALHDVQKTMRYTVDALTAVDA